MIISIIASHSNILFSLIPTVIATRPSSTKRKAQASARPCWKHSFAKQLRSQEGVTGTSTPPSTDTTTIQSHECTRQPPTALWHSHENVLFQLGLNERPLYIKITHTFKRNIHAIAVSKRTQAPQRPLGRNVSLKTNQPPSEQCLSGVVHYCLSSSHETLLRAFLFVHPDRHSHAQTLNQLCQKKHHSSR